MSQFLCGVFVYGILKLRGGDVDVSRPAVFFKSVFKFLISCF